MGRDLIGNQHNHQKENRHRHQYQWDVIGDIRRKEGINPIMSHGPSFFYFKNELEEIGIPLKTGISIRKWFTTQDLQKC